jgi:hypothetical protein
VPREGASHLDLLSNLVATAHVLAEVGRASPRAARGFHYAGMADVSGFLAMGCDEVLVHGYDVASALDVELPVPDALCREVTSRLFPWAPPDIDPLETLLWANGRLGLPGLADQDDWVWHCEPLDQWDGSIPTWSARSSHSGGSSYPGHV